MKPALPARADFAPPLPRSKSDVRTRADAAHGGTADKAQTAHDVLSRRKADIPDRAAYVALGYVRSFNERAAD